MVRVQSTVIPVGYRSYSKSDVSASATRRFNNWTAYIKSQINALHLNKVVIGSIKPSVTDEMDYLLDKYKEILTFRK